MTMLQSDSDLVTDLCLAMEFLCEHSFLYDVSNVEVISQEHLDKRMPKEWRKWAKEEIGEDYDQMNKMLEKGERGQGGLDGVPETMRRFVQKRHDVLDRLNSHLSSAWREEIQMEKEEGKKMDGKKRHEVARMAKIVEEKCKELKVECLVDVGSGLGYLEEILTKDKGLKKVICIEGNESHAKGAKERHRGNTKVEVIIRRIGEDNDLQDLLRGQGKSALVGLHCCGDLSNNMLRIFQSTDEFVAMFLVPCCFHKTELSSLPFSTSMKDRLDNSGIERQIRNQYLLRLASQEPFIRWQSRSREDHEAHAKAFASRAIIEAYSKHKGICFTKKGRRFSKAMTKEFSSVKEELVERAIQGFELLPGFKRAEYEDFVESNLHLLPELVYFTGLQQFLQAVASRFFVLDKILWLRERGFRNSVALELFDESISPMNKVLCCSRL